MIRSIRDMTGFTIRATDGDIGTVEDFFFDDESWVVRYLVDRTGGLLHGKQLLISPSGFDGPPDWERRVFPLAMTKRKVMDSPDIDTHRPVSRQKEEELLSYYGAPLYWQYYSSQTLPPIPVTPPIPEQTFEDLSRRGVAAGGAPEDVHLRSAGEVAGYAIQAVDGRFGGVRDLLVEDSDWRIEYLVADTNTWLPGGNVRIKRGDITGVSWVDRQVSVDLSVQQVRSSPKE